ncbi:SAM-dependent methyltransferase [Streptomyces sp. WMMC500]|uniref:SAM-dependent methyltransferase n=1 Tax=Streptomyces sp. WMMC500 TaxID=3015154 RepID=UPI00248B4D50|nr:SAM-dependent methyltransferase [Streptomyces sp. WMMC500]WBB59798.1 SAM-dependent methyltransferase [Streptomyces sp. WMMC500]
MTHEPPLGDRPRAPVNPHVPHPARIYDYLLGGKDHYAADRAAADETVRRAPQVRESARENRAWMRRAVRYLVGQGVRQFLDIGTGIPTSPNLHEVAQRISPDCRVVYTDNDPVVLAHARALLSSSAEGRTAYVQADLRRPEQILQARALWETLDRDRPVALMLSAVLHFVRDEEEPGRIVAAFRDALPPGSWLALSHTTNDIQPRQAADAAAVYGERRAAAPMVPRPLREVEAFFDGFDVVEPGVVQLPLWHPDGPVRPRLLDEVWLYGGVGRLSGG